MQRWMMLGALIGCGGGGDATCDTGFEERDGACYALTASTGDTGTTTPPPAEFDLGDWLDSLEPCDLPAGDGTLDLVRGCAGAACVGMTYDELNTALGEDGACVSFFYAFGDFEYYGSECMWSAGVQVSFPDDDQDGLPDPLEAAYSLGVVPPFAGTTDEGLGLGISPTCFVPVLGDPTSVSFSGGPLSDWLPSSIGWSYDGVYVYDYNGPGPYDFDSDGLIEDMTLYGSATL